MKNPNAEVYIAGPLFNAQENKHNITLAKMFREKGYSVFNPIEDGIEGAAQKISEEELIHNIHAPDFSRVMRARIFVANLDGPQVDDGTAAESGMAYVSKVGIPGKMREDSPRVKLMLAYFSDTRSLTSNMKRNPLVIGSFDAVFSNLEELVDYACKRCPPKSPR
jgi:nucleoside 2-deoxyribosyltransferase